MLRDDVLLPGLIGCLDNGVLGVRLDGQLNRLAGGAGSAADADHGAAHVVAVAGRGRHGAAARRRRHLVLGLLLHGDGAHLVVIGARPGGNVRCGRCGRRVAARAGVAA